jgi:hypothetical protein
VSDNGRDLRGGPPTEAGPTPTRRSHSALIAVLVVVLVGGVLLAAALIPRTVAEGERDGEAWRVRAAPGIFAAIVRFDGPDGQTAVSPSGSASFRDTTIWQVGTGSEIDTVLAGPTPPDARSVRVTSLERGVGEADVERVLWRRVHVAVIDQAVTVTDLVAIGRDGQVVEILDGVAPSRVSDADAPPLEQGEDAP